ncbi:MAG TPA: T9SS type A sorting domain-containing protein [Ignavibacteria bacterium]|nr:T9SS type A sorting domain-containing protein [Ignavibacteria bacterium]
MIKKYTIVLLFFSIITNDPLPVRADWVNISGGIGNLNVNAITGAGGFVFAGNDNRVYRSSNNGNNWIEIYGQSALALATNGTNVYRGYSNGFNYTTNLGSNWVFGNLTQWTTELLATGSTVYAGCFYPQLVSTNKGVWISTNSGANWTQTALNNIDIYSLAISGSYLFAGGGTNGVGGGVFKSTNNGLNWTNPLPMGGDAIASFENFVYSGAIGIYRSTNFGENWTQTSLTTQDVNALTTYNNNIVFAGTSNGFYQSTDNGITWLLRNEGMTSGVSSMAIFNGYICAGSLGQGIWRRPLSELVGIEQISSTIPEKSGLEQNYPNPFNPNTKIKFQLLKHGNAEIIIYDITGRRIQKLLNEELNAGEYEIDFNASGLSSGIYFYKLEVNSGKEVFTDTKKMVLIK